MTDPVNTDALRLFGQEMGVELPEHTELADQIIAAADELEQLRKDKETLLTTVRKAADAYVERAAVQDSNAHVATVTINWPVVAVEIMEQRDRLRTAVENAPHADGCGHVNWDADGLLRVGVCTCWKADAL